MLEVGVIGFLILLTIYFVMKAQSLQKEVKQYKYSLKSNDSAAKFTSKTLVLVTNELQKSYLSKLNTAKKHGLLKPEDFELANFILSSAAYVTTQCCEHKTTVEEAIKKALGESHFEMNDINPFMVLKHAYNGHENDQINKRVVE